MIKGTSQKHRRRSIRLKEYDYAEAGGYFVTICTHSGQMLLEPKPVKEMITKFWQKLESKFSNVQIDEFVVMPNHIHGILIVGADLCVCPKTKGEHTGSPLRVPLGRIIQWFKTMTTNEYIKNIKLNRWQPFTQKFWQRNYYEHIIRNEKSLKHIQEYIHYNPLKWEIDRENPNRTDTNEFEEQFYGKTKGEYTDLTKGEHTGSPLRVGG